jgi:hypothetical protein
MFSPTALALEKVTLPEPTQNSVFALSITAIQVACADVFMEKAMTDRRRVSTCKRTFMWVRFKFLVGYAIIKYIVYVIVIPDNGVSFGNAAHANGG